MTRLRAVLVVLVLLLAGCSAGGGASGGADASAGEGAVVGGGEQSGDVGAPDGGGAGGGGSDGAPVVDVDDGSRAVVTEGTVTFTVERPRTAAQEAAAIVEGAGGHVQERVEQAGQGGSEDSAHLVVRIPAAGLTPVLAELERLGRVDAVELTRTDVTTQAQDLDARIRALEISVARLQDLLARAQSTADVVAAEETLTERQSDLEQLVSQRARLAEQVEMSTVRLVFWTESAAPEPVQAGFLGGLAAGWDSLLTALSAGLTVLGVLVPWLALAGLVTLLTLAVRRELRRRRPPVAAAAEPVGPSPS